MNSKNGRNTELLNLENLVGDSSHGERMFRLIDKDNNQIASKYCYSIDDLENFLKKYNFTLCYYIKENQIFQLNNIDFFFNFTKECSIYSLTNLCTIPEKDFKNSIEYLKELINGPKEVNLTKIFSNFHQVFKTHFPDYNYRYFKNVEDFSNHYFFYNSSFLGPQNLIYQFFGLNGIGITTTILLTLKSFRSSVFNRFRPFLHIECSTFFTYEILDFLNYIENALIDLFINYDEFSEFVKLIKTNILKIYPNIWEIIFNIIDLYINHNPPFTKKNFYLPIIVFSHYSQDIDFQNKLNEIKEYSLQTNKFCLFIRYSDSTNLYNKKVIKYLLGNTKPKCLNYLFDNFYLPNNFNEYKDLFQVGPTILDVIRFNHGENYLEKKEEDINNLIKNFYSGNTMNQNFYLSLVDTLIGRETKLDNNIIELLNNIPLAAFSLGFIGKIEKKNNIIINYKCKIFEKIIKRISEENIVNVMNSNIYKKTEFFMKGCLFQKYIEFIIKRGKSSFGKFDFVKEIDSLLNLYDLSLEKNKDISLLFQKNAKIQEQKKNNENIKIKGKILFIQNNFFGKDFDIGIGNDNKLCSIQISLNKSIDQIKIILENLEKKSQFIIQKINTIFNLKYDEFHILFILSKSQNENTITFLKKYKIPYIIFNEENKEEQLKLDILFTGQTEYMGNQINWKKALDYKEKNNEKKNKQFLQKKKFKDIEDNNVINKNECSGKEKEETKKIPIDIIKKLSKFQIQKEFFDNFQLIEETENFNTQKNTLIIVKKKKKNKNILIYYINEDGKIEKIKLENINSETEKKILKNEKQKYYFQIFSKK